MKSTLNIAHLPLLLLFTLGALSPVAVSAAHAAPPRLSLAELPREDVKASGELLMKLPNGLHHIPKSAEDRPDQGGLAPLYLFVHGFGSRGYEWVYSAGLAVERGALYFWRWDWARCPKEASAELAQRLNQLAERHPGRAIVALGHSYGGLVLSRALSAYQGQSQLEAHAIAAPLAGHPSLTTRCGRDAQGGARPTQPHVRLIQWRTHQDLDGAFKGLKADPQGSEAPHLSLLLSRSYRGQRLGHNWSISAVFDRLRGCPKPFAEGRLMCFKQRGEREGELSRPIKE